ncbi:fumarylacetoacetate hydrolase family protein [Arthrobacter sp. ISL-95]|uniref:fumarylacetoacetate hydrolase family protein n=1 Tax=Arthrobacter sp. ISL-95 TaxID=2819116 RepID=UPI001BEB8357|nr:fumarylacetoacetate hydrolase family protein [Arthrobacter sp. ISL-95]MBT2585621.1 fumarylacetoacetate hydrolase family protein [Arthrobacter sp. ISL-95]
MQALWTEAPVLVQVVGTDSGFPVRRIYCVGRNYVDHIREMREGDERDDPFFFQKPTDAIEVDGSTIPYPRATEDFQFEGELVIAVGKRMRNGDAAGSMEAIYGYAAGIDLTRRDLQKASVSQSRPWEPGKSFDRSAPCGPILPKDSIQNLEDGTLVLHVNGEERQRTSLQLMIWSVPEILARLSELYTLEPGDLIFTGTPAGVSAVGPGDRISVEVTGLPTLSITITDQEES